jgi:aspartyl-tRNA(Asn)/glutamyl-tRNA(Gln) amidotransferase subunit A
MTRTVLDTGLMLDAMAGPHASDPHTMARVPQQYAHAAKGEGDLRRLKIGWRPLLGNRVLAAEVRALCESATKLLGDLGAEVVEMPDDVPDTEALWLTVNGAYRFAQFGHHLKQHRARMDPTLVAQLDRAASYSAQEL